MELCGPRRLWSNEQALQISRLENAQVVASSIVVSETAEGLKICMCGGERVNSDLRSFDGEAFASIPAKICWGKGIAPPDLPVLVFWVHSSGSRPRARDGGCDR